MNFNFGLLPPLARQQSRLAKKEAFAARARAALHTFPGAAADLAPHVLAAPGGR